MGYNNNDTLLLGITGSPNYTDKIKIKKFIYDSLLKKTKKYRIITLGQKSGADRIVKDICLDDFNVPYGEIPPFYKEYNQWCILPAYRYNKEYSKALLFSSLNEYVKRMNIIILFTNDNNENTDYIYNKSKKTNKNLILL
jgi:hypothetical protein